MRRAPASAGRPALTPAAERTLLLPGVGAVVVGLDLSLTRAAACIVPVDWDLDWRRVEWLTVGGAVEGGKGSTAANRVQRIDEIASAVVGLFGRLVDRGAVIFPCVENYAFDAAHQAHQIGEVGGVVRVDLWRRFRFLLEPVASSSARKILLGKVPKSSKEAKAQVMGFLHLAGAECPNHDAGDAYAIANVKLCEFGKGITAMGGR